jgi:hypothetical protein
LKVFMTRVVFLFLVAASVPGCSNNSTTSPTLSGTVTETFVGTLDVNGASFYSFTVSTSGTTSVTLASITTGVPGPAANLPVNVGIGVPAGTGCPVTTSLDISPALIAQVTSTLTPGIYCVNIADIGNLASSVNFAIRITHT